jgi:hypothetical protein
MKPQVQTPIPSKIKQKGEDISEMLPVSWRQTNNYAQPPITIGQLQTNSDKGRERFNRTWPHPEGRIKGPVTPKSIFKVLQKREKRKEVRHT